MDAEMLKIICDSYERRIAILVEGNRSKNEMLHNLDLRALCVARGGHEYIQVGNAGLRYKQCKYCGKPEDAD